MHDANLSLEGVICHPCQAGLILLKEGFAPTLKVAGAEAGGLQDEGHTAAAHLKMKKIRSNRRRGEEGDGNQEGRSVSREQEICNLGNQEEMVRR